MKHLYDSLRGCAKEEEVKAEFCKFFRMKIFALRGIDHYTERVLFEFKYDRNFRNAENVARVLAQVMYYARLLKFGAGLTKYPLPPYICVVDKNEAFFAETKDYARFYAAKGDRYDWDRAPSTPCPKLVEDMLSSFVLKGNNINNFEKQLSGEARANSPAQASSKTAAPVGAAEREKVVFTSCPGCFQLPYIYDLTNPAEEEQFVAKCRERLTTQATFLDLLDKKAITEENFLDVFAYWDGLFGPYVRNGRKSSEYFLSDIEQGKSIVAQDGQVLFSVSGATGNFPVGFLVWNLAKKRHLAEQDITLDVFNADVEKIGTKRFPSVERTAMLNKWCPRPKWDGKSIMPTFVSAFNLKTDNKDKRNHVAPGFLCSVSSNGDDFQHTNSVFILSAPYANAGAFSVTPENFERAMVLHAVKKIPKATWTNDRDAFYAPANFKQTDLLTPNGVRDPENVSRVSGEQIRLLKPTDPQTGLPSEFVTDCVVWSAFADSNYAVSLRNVQYQGRVWQIANNLFPFLLDEVRQWPCAHGDIAAQLAAANEDRFLAKWLAAREKKQQTDLLTPNGVRDSEIVSGVSREQIRLLISPEARAVLDEARRLYREFYANITRTPWMDWKIETWDVGYYQVRNAMKGLLSLRGDSEARSFGEDSKNPPNFQLSKTPSSESKEASVPLCLCDRNNPATALREAHDALRAKLLPQIYSLGFLNPDVEYFS